MSEEKKFKQYKGYLFGEWKEKVLEHMEGLGYDKYKDFGDNFFKFFSDKTIKSYSNEFCYPSYFAGRDLFQELTPEQFLTLTEDDVIEKNPPLRIAKYTPILGHDLSVYEWTEDFLINYDPNQELPYIGRRYSHHEIIIFDYTNKEHIDLIGDNKDYPGSIKDREVIIYDGTEEERVKKLFSIVKDVIEKTQEIAAALQLPKHNQGLTDGELVVPVTGKKPIEINTGDELVKTVEKAIAEGKIKITTGPIIEEVDGPEIPEIPELAKVPDSEIILNPSEEWLKQNLEVGDTVELKTTEEYEEVPEYERTFIHKSMIQYMGEHGIVQNIDHNSDYGITIEFPNNQSFFYNLNIIKSVEKKSK